MESIASAPFRPGKSLPLSVCSALAALLVVTGVAAAQDGRTARAVTSAAAGAPGVNAPSVHDWG
ncbi:hypothetical protein GXW82_10165 [Streptacidiphilus sp. 4-A2]|nr:hypothetical protein [Streptacidiphilus sp. 4-A2]